MSADKPTVATRVEQRIARRAGVDVELTYSAFQLPAVYDRQNVSRATDPRSLKREFYVSTSNKSKSKLAPPTANATAQNDKENERKDTSSKVAKDYDVFLMDEEEDETNTDNYRRVRHVIFSQALRQNIARLESKGINFSDIVDIDQESFETHINEDIAARFGEGDAFRVFILVVILLNSVVIGLQTDSALATTASTVFTIVDHVFLAIFIMEIVFKWYYGFFNFWKSGWNWFDLLIVAAALAGPAFTFLSNSRILRILRVLRAFRSLRSVSALSGLQAVVATILRAIPDMLNVIVLISLLMFIFSVLGTTLFSPYDPTHWGDLGISLFSLYVLLTQDGWVDLFDKLEAQGQFIAAAIFFFVYITIAAFVLSNVLSAVVVYAYNETSQALRKAHEQKFRALKSTAKATTGQPQFLRQTVPLPDIEERIWNSQVPLEVPDFDKFSRRKLENYFLILTVIEENLKEYVLVKEQIQEILMEIRNLNDTTYDGDMEDFEEDLDLGSMEEENEEGEEAEGDVLSRLMRSGVRG